MATFVCLLRGINVSGKNKIAMADLKTMFVDLGFSSVITYIQSGNVIFSTDESNINEGHALATIICQAINHHYQYTISAVVIEKKTFIEHAKNNPFLPISTLDTAPLNLETDGTKILFTFLNNVATADQQTSLLSYVKPPERLIIKQDVIYLHCPDGYGKSKLSNNFIENKLKVSATTRNVKTVQKLVELLA